MAQNSSNLTEGGITKTLVRFAIPFLIANFIQALYSTVDMAVVGWFSNSAGIAAVSIGADVSFIITAVVSGLTMGGTILIAQYCGAEKQQDAIDTISTMLSLSVVLAVIITVAMQIAAVPILRALNTPPEAFAYAEQYVRICTGGSIFIFGYNAISAILRGFGDSKSPLYFIATACCVNIVLDLVFVGGLRMGAAGAALATIMAQAISMIFAVIYLSRHDFIFKFSLKSFKFHKEKVRRLLKVGLPISLQDSTIMLSFLFISSIINKFGVTAAAAVGIAAKFENFAMLPSNAFSGALSAIVGQNMGAGLKDRAKKTMNRAILMSLCCASLFFVWAQLAPESILMIFKADAETAAVGARYLKGFSFDFLAVAFYFSQNGFMNGCGKTTISMISGLLGSIAIRLPLAYLFSIWMPTDLFGVSLAAPLASLGSAIFGCIYIATGRWKKNNLIQAELTPVDV